MPLQSEVWRSATGLKLRFAQMRRVRLALTQALPPAVQRGQGM